MMATQTREGEPNPQTIWAILQEVAEAQRETARQLDEERQERKEADRRREEERKETDRQLREYNKRFGEFSNRFGEIVEYMVAPNLRDKFNEMGFGFQETSSNKVFASKDGIFLFEVDVMLENGDKAMLVETKTKPTTKDVDDHIKRLKKMRDYASSRGDSRTFMGAVAGAVMTSNVRSYILSKGLFAVEPSGETFTITAPEGSPGEW